jgi:hypothetical protein
MIAFTCTRSKAVIPLILKFFHAPINGTVARRIFVKCLKVCLLGHHIAPLLPNSSLFSPVWFFVVFFLVGLNLNSWLQVYKVGTLPVQSNLQSILLWLFWRGWGEISRTICLGWPRTLIFYSQPPK